MIVNDACEVAVMTEKDPAWAATGIVIFDSRILLILHPRQKKWIPPGDSFIEMRNPHDVAVEAVEREPGSGHTFIYGTISRPISIRSVRGFHSRSTSSLSVNLAIAGSPLIMTFSI